MGALSEQDFEKGVDFTGINPATAADHNQLVDLATPKDDADGAGKGLVINTVDSAINVPVVPDASVTTKWKLYIWVRKPHVGATETTPIPYAWNDDLPNNDPTFLKWLPIGADIVALQAEIDNLAVQVDNAKSTADNALGQSTAAVATAQVASDTAAAAQVSADNAVVIAGDATATAAASQSTANEAKTIAQAAQNSATTKKDVNAALTPGTAFQLIRTNRAADGVEWFKPVDTYVRIQEQQNVGVDAGAAVLGKNTRSINTVTQDTGANVASLAASVLTLKKGTYRVFIKCPGYNRSHQALLVKNADNTTLLTGTTCANASSPNITVSEITGILTLVDDVTGVRIDDYFAAAQGNGLGVAANVHPDAGGKEVYTVAEFWKIG